MNARLARGAELAALGLMVGLAIGVVDGRLAPPMAGESATTRALGVLLVDGAAGLLLGCLAGVLRACRSGPSPGRARAWLAVGVAGAGALAAGVAVARADGALDAELALAWRLERPLPALTATAPRGVLLITLDTVRADALDHMPRLAARARGALRFPRARSTSSWTLPAVASVHTGLPYPAHGAGRMVASGAARVRTGLDPGLPVLAETLAARGFVNAAVTTNPFNGMRYGFHRGFDRFHDLSRAALRATALRRASLARPLVPPRRAGAREVTDAAVGLLDALAPTRFFLWLHYLDAHAPYAEDPATHDDGDPCEMPACFGQWSRVRSGRLDVSEADRARVRALYAGELAWLDGELDRVFARLETAGAAGRTLVVVTADHGEAFWEQGDVEHGGSLRDTVVGVPLLVWVPGRAGATVTTAVDVTAVAPAVRAWVDDGSLGPLDAGADMVTPLGGLLFAEGMDGCTDGRTKAVRARGPAGVRMQVYDLAADPAESRPGTEAPAHLVACMDAAAARVGQGAAGDAAALRALGYAD